MSESVFFFGQILNIFYY